MAMNKYLLDTHIFIWAGCYPEKLPKHIASLLQNPSDVFYISMATFWEMQIKYQLGKLFLPRTLDELIKEIKKYHYYEILPITQTHILNLQTLEFHHKDPFDRMIISQAMYEHLTVLTVDSEIIKYPIECIS